MGAVALVQVDAELEELLCSNLPADGVCESVAGVEELIVRLGRDGPPVDALVLGPCLPDPLRVAQRAYSVNRDVAVLILCEPPLSQQLARALPFTPFLGEDVICQQATDRPALPIALADLLNRARQRRTHRAIIAALNERLASTPPPPPLAAQYLDQLLNYLPIGVVAVDARGVLLDWSLRAREILGWNEPNRPSGALADLFPRPERARLADLIRRCLVANQHPEIFECEADGQPCFVEVSAAAVHRANEPGAMVLLQDVTGRVRAERELLARAREAALGADVGVALTSRDDLRAKLQRCAEAIARHLDAAFARIWTLNEAERTLELQASAGMYTHLDGPHSRVPVGLFKIGMIASERQAHLTNHVIGDPRVSNQEWARREGMVAFAGYPLIAEDRLVGVMAMFARRPLAESTIGALASIADGIALGIVQFWTEEERARLLVLEQAARAEAQEAIRARDHFLWIASHELKTPLTSLLGYAQLLERRISRDGGLPPRDQRALRVIVEQAARLNKMVTALLDLSRIETGQLSIERAPLDLVALVARLVTEIQPTLDRHTLRYTGPITPLMLAGDELRLEQVLQNLIGNAIKYSPAGGVVEIGVEQCDGWACVSVRDEGIGIPQEALARLFQRFYRARNAESQQISGMGLGLYVVKEIVSLHSGEIEIASEEGRGSTFTVRLPIS